MAAGLSTSVRAAASSMASGRPSSAMHTAAMSAATASSISRSVSDRGRPLDEQRDGGVRGDLAGASSIRWWQVQGWHRPGDLARHPERAPAGGEHRTPGAVRNTADATWAAAATTCSQVSSTTSTFAGRQRLGDRRHRVVARCDRHASGGGDRRGDEAGSSIGLKST